MRTSLIEFLFGATVIQEKQGSDLGEEIVKLFEEADEVEGVEMVANKKPLADALKAIGIDEPVEEGAQWCEIRCTDDVKYHEYCRALAEPDAMHKLAEMGWVTVKCGDSGMSNEKPDYKIGFIEIQTAETTDGDKPKDAEKIRKDAQADAASLFKRDDKMNPVELEDPKMGEKQTGVGKTADGKDPEGTPKGAKKVKESKSPKALVDSLLDAPPLQEMTGTSAVPAFPDSGRPMLRSPARRKKLPVTKPNASSPKSSPNLA